MVGPFSPLREVAGQTLVIRQGKGPEESLERSPIGACIENADIELIDGQAFATVSRRSEGGSRHFGLWNLSPDFGNKEYFFAQDYDLTQPKQSGVPGMFVAQASTRPCGSDESLRHLVVLIDKRTGALEVLHDGTNGWARPITAIGPKGAAILLVSDVGGHRIEQFGVDLRGCTLYESAGKIELARFETGSLAIHESFATSPGRIVWCEPETRKIEIVDDFQNDATPDVRPRTRIVMIGGRIPHTGAIHEFGESKSRGTVYMFHGGPTMRWIGWSRRWNPVPYLEMGFRVVQIDPAGSEGFGASSSAAAWKSWRNIILSASFLVNRDRELNRPSFTVYAGASFGGYLALGLSFETSPDFAVAHCAPTRPSHVYLTSDAHWSWLREWGSENPRRDDLVLPAVAPRTRYLLSHGMRDLTVPYVESVYTARALAQLGTDVELRLFRDSGHSLGEPFDRLMWESWVFSRLRRQLEASAV